MDTMASSWVQRAVLAGLRSPALLRPKYTSKPTGTQIGTIANRLFLNVLRVRIASSMAPAVILSNNLTTIHSSCIVCFGRWLGGLELGRLALL